MDNVQDCGFFESFKPFYSYEYCGGDAKSIDKKDKKKKKKAKNSGQLELFLSIVLLKCVCFGIA